MRKGKGLTEEQRDDFEDLLRGLTTHRQRIRDVMGFAIDNSEAAGEIVQVLTEALTLDETPIPTKIARLFLVSDILHNSTAAVRNAHAYRSLFQKQLPNVFESFSTALRNAAGRMSAEQLKEQVMRVLRVWEAWSVYPQPFLATLHETFLRPAPQEEEEERAKVREGGAEDDGDEDIDGIPLTEEEYRSLIELQQRA